MTKTDKFFAAFFSICALLTVYGFFGLTAFAVIGTVVALLALVAVIGWINEKTGGLVGWLLLIGSI